MNKTQRACQSLQEFIQTDNFFISEIENKLEKFKSWLLNSSESLSSDQEILLKFHHKKLDQFCRIMKQYREKLTISNLNEAQFDEYFEHCVGNLTNFVDNDQYVETFIVNGAYANCLVWKELYSKITSYNSMQEAPINILFLSRMARYHLLIKDLRKSLENEGKIEKCDFLIKKIEIVSSKIWQNCTLLAYVKKNSEFLQEFELYYYDFTLIGLEVEIFDFKMENQLVIENGYIAISKMGELLLFNQNSNEIELNFGLYKLDSDSGEGLGKEIELIKSIDIKDAKKFRIIYGQDKIQINSKESQLIFRFKKKDFQISMWNTLIMKRQAAPSYFQFSKANNNYQDVNFNFE